MAFERIDHILAFLPEHFLDHVEDFFQGIQLDIVNVFCGIVVCFGIFFLGNDAFFVPLNDFLQELLFALNFLCGAKEVEIFVDAEKLVPLGKKRVEHFLSELHDFFGIALECRSVVLPACRVIFVRVVQLDCGADKSLGFLNQLVGCLLICSLELVQVLHILDFQIVD